MAHLSSVQFGKLTRLSFNELIHRSIYTTSTKVSKIMAIVKLRNCENYQFFRDENDFLSIYENTYRKFRSKVNVAQILCCWRKVMQRYR